MNEAGFRSAMAPADRWLCTLGGAMLLGRGLGLVLTRRRRLAASAMTLTGGALLARGAMAMSSEVRQVRVVRAEPEDRAAAEPEPAATEAAAEEIPIEPPANVAPPASTRPEHDRHEQDRVDEASEESFPASDSPSWTSSGVGGPRHGDEPERR